MEQKAKDLFLVQVVLERQNFNHQLVLDQIHQCLVLVKQHNKKRQVLHTYMK